jgi:hypothetical protein
MRENMYWTEVKSELLYGHSPLTQERLQPQAVQIAVREISRLINFGWIDELTEDVQQRIQKACQVSQCSEIWDEFRVKNQFLFQRKSRKRSRKKRQKK